MSIMNERVLHVKYILLDRLERAQSALKALWSCVQKGEMLLALSQRLSPLGLIFRFSISTFDKMLLINFRIS